jgi:hypothetical protein
MLPTTPGVGAEAIPGMPPPEAGEAGVTPPEGTPVPGAEAGAVPGVPPEEIAADTMLKSLGKEFIIENQRDFFRILKYINEANNRNLIESVDEWHQLKEELGEIFVRSMVEPNTNNVRRQFIINEFGGIHFKNGDGEAKVEIYESNKDKTKDIDIGEYKTKTIILG